MPEADPTYLPQGQHWTDSKWPDRASMLESILSRWCAAAGREHPYLMELSLHLIAGKTYSQAIILADGLHKNVP